MQLALALQSVVCWLLSCMYSSLETLSDVISDFPAEAEDSKIVLKCRNLIDYFLNDAYLVNLIHVANKEDEGNYFITFHILSMLLIYIFRGSVEKCVLKIKFK